MNEYEIRFLRKDGQAAVAFQSIHETDAEALELAQLLFDITRSFPTAEVRRGNCFMMKLSREQQPEAEGPLP
jgi:HD superfamily phosphohydrolase YqeK